MTHKEVQNTRPCGTPQPHCAWFKLVYHPWKALGVTVRFHLAGDELCLDGGGRGHRHNSASDTSPLTLWYFSRTLWFCHRVFEKCQSVFCHFLFNAQVVLAYRRTPLTPHPLSPLFSLYQEPLPDVRRHLVSLMLAQFRQQSFCPTEHQSSEKDEEAKGPKQNHMHSSKVQTVSF